MSTVIEMPEERVLFIKQISFFQERVIEMMAGSTQ